MNRIAILFVLCLVAFASGAADSDDWTFWQWRIFGMRCDTLVLRTRISRCEALVGDAKFRIDEITKKLNQLKEKHSKMTGSNFKTPVQELDSRLGALEAKKEKSYNESCYASFKELEDQFSKVERKVRYFAINENTHSRKRDCAELLKEGNTENGVYTIYADLEPIEVYCDMQNGGWTVIQKRSNAFSQADSDLYNQNFDEYVIGFGERAEDHWLGLDNMHTLTKFGSWVLRVDESHDKEEGRFSQYENFSIGSGSKYTLHLGQHSGTAGDSLGHFRGRQFLTPDKVRGFHCSRHYSRGWWYKACDETKLNSLSMFRSIPEGEERFYPSSITMKIRRSEDGLSSPAQ